MLFGLARFQKRVHEYVDANLARLYLPFKGHVESARHVATLLVDLLGKEDSPGLLERADTLFQDAPELNQVISRELRKLMSEELVPAMLLKVAAMGVFARVVLAAFGGEENFDPRAVGDKAEWINTLQKNQNARIVTFRGILTYLVEGAPEHGREILGIEDFPGLIEHVYGISLAEDKGVKEFKETGPRELIMEYQLEGALPRAILEKFSGLITYSMSILTMVSGHPELQKYAEALDSTLSALGTGTQVTIFSQRLSRALEDRADAAQQMDAVWAGFLEKAETRGIPVKNLTKILHNYPTERQFDGIIPVEDSTEEKTAIRQFLLAIPKALHVGHFIPDIKRVEQFMRAINARNREISLVLSDFHAFLDGLIKKVNQLTSELFARGFKARLPVQDVEQCEAAGIHLHTIVDSATCGGSFDDILYDEKVRLIREFDRLELRVKKALGRRSQEEQLAIKNPEKQALTRVARVLRQTRAKWEGQGYFEARSEEILYLLRVLTSVNALWRAVHVELGTIEDVTKGIPLNKGLLQTNRALKATIESLQERARDVEAFDALLDILKPLSHHLVEVNPMYSHLFMKDPEYLADPETLETFLEPTPATLKRELAQRLYTKERYDTKVASFAQVQALLEELKALPSTTRGLLKVVDEETLKEKAAAREAAACN